MRVFNFPFWRFYFYKMPRYYNRRYKRRYSKRKTTGAKNVFMNRSAKSQAKQIYSLSKRVNKVYNVCKPEYKVYDGANATYTFSSGDITNTYKITYFNGPSQGLNDDQFVGNKIRCVSLDLYFTGEYYNTSDTGYHGTESAGTPFRIIVLQRKEATDSTISISDVLSTSGGSGADYTMQAICPLKRGITDNFRVLLDKKIIFTSAKNQALRHYKMRPNNLKWNSAYKTNGFITVLVSAGLHYDANFNEYVEGTVKEKLVYTDA